MPKQIFVNLPVRDLVKSTAFYEALGFKKNAIFSNEKASAMMWSDTIFVMLLVPEFFQTFIGNKTVSDATIKSEVALCLTFESKEEVQQFADTAKNNGGTVYSVDSGTPEGAMFGFEVTDIDGHLWEPLWMNPDFKPN